MLKNIEGFQQLHPILRPMKILLGYEKKNITEYFKYANIDIPITYGDDLICKQLGAQIGDIICIQKKHTNLYRLVIEK